MQQKKLSSHSLFGITTKEDAGGGYSSSHHHKHPN
jgi:hypothetical protein